MVVRLGYVAMTLYLKDCSPSSTVTVTAYDKLPNDEAKRYRLKKLTKSNLDNTYRILLYNQAMDVNVYRFTSKLIPLATHPAIEGWDYVEDFKEEFKKIGDFVKENDFRVSAHPDHYTLINSPNKTVIEDSIKDLDYHVRLYEAMGLDDYRYKLVMHVGGLYKDKKTSIERFKENFIMLPERIRKRIILENDDKSYTAVDVLGICQELKIPMVLDVHHHNCVNNGESLKDILKDIYETWEGEYFVPKIHFSSPKNDKDFRSHADTIEVDAFREFVDIAHKTGKDFDVMLEAKNKDLALQQLTEELKDWDKIHWLNQAAFEVV